tara:strand:- start:468 stop:995 length:528 start_codon:yes stop_codon:yes gene_type:complete
MPITYDSTHNDDEENDTICKTFINTYTFNILKSLSLTGNDTSISGFLLVEASGDNFEFELNEAINGRKSYWNKPSNFDDYRKKNNLLIIVDYSNDKVYLFLQENSEYLGREHWELTRIDYGTVELTYIGILNMSKNDIEQVLSYKKFPTYGKNQKIKCSYSNMMNNLKNILYLNT